MLDVVFRGISIKITCQSTGHLLQGWHCFGLFFVSLYACFMCLTVYVHVSCDIVIVNSQIQRNIYKMYS